MTDPDPPPDDSDSGGGVSCADCHRPLRNPVSRVLHRGPVCLARAIGTALGRGRRVAAIHAGQLVLDLDGDLEHLEGLAHKTEKANR